MSDTFFKLTQDDLNKVAEVASKKAIEIYKKEAERDRKKIEKQHDKVVQTKRMLESYRRIKNTLTEEVKFDEYEMAEYRWKFIEDLMGSVDDREIKEEKNIKAQEERRNRDIFAITCIDKALKLYKKEVECAASEEDVRRYRVLTAIYINEDAKTVEEVANEEGISTNSVYRDIGIAAKILSVYLLGM